MTSFRPWPLTAGGHRQTLLGYWLRRHLRWTLAAEDLLVEAPDGIRLLLRAGWQPDRAARPTLFLIHGLGGSDAATYNVATGVVAWRRGWNVVRLNLRGAGDALTHSARLYHAGVDEDVVAALSVVAAIAPRIALAGFSLGGNLALLTLARNRGRVPPGLFACAAVSPPVDLAACARALERPQNRLYQRHYMAGLRAAYRERQRLLPHLYEAGREQGLQTVWQYDDAITAPYGGFQGVEDYYARSSAGPLLTDIDRPALLLAAEDDPLVPAESVRLWPLAPGMSREMTGTGGHVGFVGRCPAPGRFWAAERVVGFLEGAAG